VNLPLISGTSCWSKCGVKCSTILAISWCQGRNMRVIREGSGSGDLLGSSVEAALLQIQKYSRIIFFVGLSEFSCCTVVSRITGDANLEKMVTNEWNLAGSIVVKHFLVEITSFVIFDTTKVS
jgi:hypothetical protein